MIDLGKDFFYYTAYAILHGLLAWRFFVYLSGKWARLGAVVLMATGYTIMVLQLGLVAGIWQGMVTLSAVLLPPEILLQRFLPNRHHHKLIFTFMSLLLLATTWGLYTGLALPTVEKQSFVLEEWQANGSRKMVHISDLHHRPGDLKRLQTIVELVNAQNPDWVVFSGDMMLDVNWPQAEKAVLKNLRSRFGVYAVRGNHEVKPGGSKGFVEFCHSAGIVPLVNTAIESDGLFIGGIDEAFIATKKKNMRWNLPSGNLELTLAGIPANRPIILLAHRSSWAYRASAIGVDLMLCGHSHGGQLPPISWLVAMLDAFAAGEYRIDGMDLSVSSGAGTWGYLPLRLFSRNTIHLISLVPGRRSEVN